MAPTATPRVAVENLTVADLRILARKAGYQRLARSGRKADLIAALFDGVKWKL